MKSKKENHTKVIVRGSAAGGITKADIERRARELALIRGVPNEVTDADRQQARRELIGGETPAPSDEEARVAAVVSRDPSEPPEIAPEERPAGGGNADDEEAMVERLALQGVEEAQHDQMVQARKRREEEE